MRLPLSHGSRKRLLLFPSHHFENLRAYVLPQDVRALADGQYFRHLLAPARTIELDAWGQQFAVYRHRQPDDFAHAEVYATLASIRATLSETDFIGIGFGPRGPYAINFDRSDYADR